MTFGVVILFIAIGRTSVRVLLGFDTIDAASIFIHSGILLLFITILLGSYLFSPQKYEIRERQLIIHRLAGGITINLNDIIEIRTIKKGELSGTIRTFGNGGLFAYYGKFYHSAFGSMTYYVTQRKNMVLLQTDTGKKIVISPDDTNMANRLNELISKES